MGYMKSFILSIILSIILVSVLNVFLNKSNTKLRDKIKWQHYLFGYLFMLYLMISLLDVVGFPSLHEWRRLLALNQPIFNPEINLIPFNDGIEISGILNIIFFMPFGFLLPTLWKKYRRLMPVIAQGVILSFIIEVGQLFTKYRASDINDLIMNTLGAIIGWILFKVLSKIFKDISNSTAITIYNEEVTLVKIEPFIYIAIALISAFIF